MNKRVVVLISGVGTNLIRLYAQSGDSTYNIVGVVSSNKNCLGYKFAKLIAKKTKLKCRLVSEKDGKINNIALAKAIVGMRPDVICLAGFMPILRKPFFCLVEEKMPNVQILNIHPSLLPEFKGLNAVKRALDAGESQSGCTVHRVIGEVDSGEILGQRSVDISGTDDEESLTMKIQIQERLLYPQIVARVIREVV